MPESLINTQKPVANKHLILAQNWKVQSNILHIFRSHKKG